MSSILIPLVDVRAQYEELRAELLRAVTRTFEEADYILGREVELFEAEFASYCGTSQAIGVSTGLAALHLALRALDLKPGDEVITAANTFVATVLAIRSAGATPVLVDVEEHSMNLDPAAVAAAITPRTRVLMPVHLFGQPAEMEPLESLARHHNLSIVEDASQAHGAEYHGKRTGTFGVAGCFSLYPTKNLGAVGDAGILTTSSPDLAARVRSLRNYGMSRKYHCDSAGSNERLDTLQAALLRVKLPCLDRWNDLRRKHASVYHELLEKLPVERPTELPDRRHVYYVYVIRTAKRDELESHLRGRGIVTGVHYPIPIPRQAAFANEIWAQERFPVTERLAGEILSLPMYPHLRQEQMEQVVTAIAEFFR